MNLTQLKEAIAGTTADEARARMFAAFGIELTAVLLVKGAELIEIPQSTIAVLAIPGLIAGLSLPVYGALAEYRHEQQR